MAQAYTEASIKTLSSTEHIRLRPGMYIGRLGNGTHAEEITTDSGPRLRFVTTDGSRLSFSEAPFEGRLTGLSRRMLLSARTIAMEPDGRFSLPAEFATALGRGAHRLAAYQRVGARVPRAPPAAAAGARVP